MSVLVETTLGDIVIDVYVKERPKSAMNFIKLCKMKYYNLCQFHTIEQNYVAQTGDPTGTGRGGESVYVNMYGEQGKYFEQEDLPKMKHTRVGVVSFVNNGNDMLGSQFFITLGDDLDYLDNQHTIFGQVTEGLDTLEKLNEQLCDDDHKPFKDIRIAHTIVLDDPFESSSRLKYPERSPSPTFEMLVQTNKIALDDKVNDDEGKTAEEVAEELKKKEMKEQAQILEMVGDLHHADEAPPDNVLFVCKLNPVTTDEDLEIIFSRFGKIIKCEVIRDRRSQQSLQYAFIEFEDPKSCEQAFFKMDNVLIDDRRIHVDFSQSVAKNFKWNKGGHSDPEPKGKRERSPVERTSRSAGVHTEKRKYKEGDSNRKHGYRDASPASPRRRDRSPPRRRERSPPRRERSPPRRRERSPPRKRERSRSPTRKRRSSSERHHSDSRSRR